MLEDFESVSYHFWTLCFIRFIYKEVDSADLKVLNNENNINKLFKVAFRLKHFQIPNINTHQVSFKDKKT